MTWASQVNENPQRPVFSFFLPPPFCSTSMPPRATISLIRLAAGSAPVSHRRVLPIALPAVLVLVGDSSTAVRIPGIGRAARLLVLASSLLFVLPHGWCCLLACQLAKIAACSTPARARTCCERRNHDAPPGHGERPSPLPPSRCPCYDRHTILPDAPTADHGNCDLAIVATAPPADDLTAFIRIDVAAVCVVHPPTIPPHIAKCVWRC
jgi:hypothetical protein